MRIARSAVVAVLVGFAMLLMPGFIAPSAAHAAPAPAPDGQVYVGGALGYGGTKLFPIYYDGDTSGEPDAWAYCIEHDIDARTGAWGTVVGAGDFLGENGFTDPAVQGKVFWILANSYPAVPLEAFGAAAGVAGISQNDAIEAITYAVWRYTEYPPDADYGPDINWPFASADSRAAYRWLVNSADAADTSAPAAPTPVSVSVTAPTAAFTAGDLVGPFTVETSGETAQVVTDPALALVDIDGNAIDASAVADGQQVYVDTRGTEAAGDVTVSASVIGATPTYKIISVPRAPGSDATAESHAQTIAIVTAIPETAAASATASWAAVPVAPVPAIGTTLLDAADGDHVLPAAGGTVIDTITYENLTPGARYTVTGELMNRADGAPTGITGSTTFTPSEANGTVEVEFVVPEGYAGSALVAFERLYLGADTSGAPVAVHEDITDEAQTVSVQPAPATTTPTEQPKPAAPAPAPGAKSGALAHTGGASTTGIAAVAAIGIAAGAALLLARRRSQARER
ncbi:VaFE repeat-containing surface-anchored protein [Leucobacter sp. gxy201]|uniref:VaFE repeat-containing surface-anchored protein n=1 Tax=Leucobacter sp. gxy201 TaxID=2957200 RepID=UPI003DA0001C